MQHREDVQFIKDSKGRPAFAVIPYSQYEALMDSQPKAEALASLAIRDNRFIDLPEAAGEYIDLVRLVDYCQRQATVSLGADDDRQEKLEMYKESLPINARAQALERFEAQFSGGLDPLIRRFFLSADSPYKNTMQATKEVVDALVDTGIFKRSKRKFDFYRPVNALDYDAEAGAAYLKTQPKPTNPIPTYFWYTR